MSICFVLMGGWYGHVFLLMFKWNLCHCRAQTTLACVLLANSRSGIFSYDIHSTHMFNQRSQIDGFVFCQWPFIFPIISNKIISMKMQMLRLQIWMKSSVCMEDKIIPLSRRESDIFKITLKCLTSKSLLFAIVINDSCPACQVSLIEPF